MLPSRSSWTSGPRSTSEDGGDAGDEISLQDGPARLLYICTGMSKVVSGPSKTVVGGVNAEKHGK